MNFLKNTIFFILFYFFTAIFAVLSIPLLLCPRKYIRFPIMIWSNFLTSILYFIFKIDFKILGNINNKQVIYAVKHQSIWETIILANYLPGPLSIVMKSELIAIPIIGQLFKKAGAIPLNRGKQIQAVKKLLSSSFKAIEKGDNIIIYPQGTRVSPGEHKPYLPGVYALYNHLKIPVVPIALNSGKFWNKFHIFGPGTIKVSVLSEISPGMGKNKFMSKLKFLIENESKKLLK